MPKRTKYPKSQIIEKKCLKVDLLELETSRHNYVRHNYVAKTSQKCLNFGLKDVVDWFKMEKVTTFF